MSIKIDVPFYLQSYTSGMQVVEVNGNTVGECLNHLVKQFPGMKKMLLNQNGRLYSYVNIYINGRDAHPEELAKPVKDEDELRVLYIISGG